jgi:hypothetical protein
MLSAELYIHEKFTAAWTGATYDALKAWII